jgi:hypothetical protein
LRNHFGALAANALIRFDSSGADYLFGNREPHYSHVAGNVHGHGGTDHEPIKATGDPITGNRSWEPMTATDDGNRSREPRYARVEPRI